MLMKRWTIAGLALLTLWAAWWAVSIPANKLVVGERTWVPCWEWLGCDFDINYFGSRTWLAGGDPYQGYHKGTVELQYDHPPLVLALFSWSGLLPHQTAFLVWLSALALIATLGGVACWRHRAFLGVSKVPLPFVLAAVLLSYPVLFEMERGNWNLLVLLLVVAAAWALRSSSLGGDYLAGLCIGVAAWIKIYPGLLLLGLLALRRWRAATVCIAAGLAIALVSGPGVLAFAENIRDSASRGTPDQVGGFFASSHTLAGCWGLLCSHFGLSWPARAPGAVGWAVVVLPQVLWVSRRVRQACSGSGGHFHNAPRLLYPYLLWLTAAATFLPAIANDYNLFFLLLAALAVWDRRDPVIVHVLMATVVLWWQPVALPARASFLWLCKLVGLATVAVSLARRACEQAASEAADSRQDGQPVVPPALAA
jgi:hypothetical protein